MLERSMKSAESKKEVLSLVGAIFLGAILIIAAVGKVFDPVLFVEQIREEGLEGILSASTIGLVALALEMGLGFALLLGIRSLWVLVPTSAMVGFFLLLTGRTYWLVITGQLDNTYDCGCFGIFLQRTVTEAFWQDLFLMVPALFLAYLSTKALFRWPKPWKMVVSFLAAVGIVLWVVFIVGLPPAATLQADDELTQEADVFQVSEQFSVIVDGEEDTSAMVYESPASLRFLIISEQLGSSIIIDARTSVVSRNSRILAVSPDQDRYALDSSLVFEDVGTFEVSSEGLVFAVEAVEVLMRNRVEN